MRVLPLSSVLRDTPFRSEVTCPNCWHCFPPEAVWWIAVHPKSDAEPQLPSGVLGGAERLRFIPERFDPEGRALDAYGASCTQVACPRCKLQIPRACLELPTLVLSILGAPGSGKSVFIASLTFAMRQRAAELGFRFHDADVNLNRLLVEDERKLFKDVDAEQFRPIDEAIQKTQLDDARYRTSFIDGHAAKFVPPYTFVLAPGAEHPFPQEQERLARLLCLYDNAGEHFMPGADTVDQPMTQHLAASKGLIFTFDPTNERSIRRALGVGPTQRVGTVRQDLVLSEAASRIRQHSGISARSFIPQPLVVVLTKFDAWQALMPEYDGTQCFKSHPIANIRAIYTDQIQSVSQKCKAVLWEHCREIVNAAESISKDVIYIPVPAAGRHVRFDAKTGQPTFRSADRDPYEVLTPLLLLLNKHAPRLCPSLHRRAPN